jgi:hypothetical protein
MQISRMEEFCHNDDGLPVSNSTPPSNGLREEKEPHQHRYDLSANPFSSSCRCLPGLLPGIRGHICHPGQVEVMAD